VSIAKKQSFSREFGICCEMFLSFIVLKFMTADLLFLPFLLGFGVYNYSNKFFRYEGEWCKGKKHGNLPLYSLYIDINK